MIKNEKQYRISKASANKFKLALKKLEQNSKLNLQPLLRAEYEGMKSQYDELVAELSEYEKLVKEQYHTFFINTIEELPITFIKARIAQNFSQKELAEKLGLKEQQIQRYEATNYSSASFDRIKLICKVLNVVMDSKVFIQHQTHMKTVLEKIINIGFSKEFILTKLLPPSLSERIKLYEKRTDQEKRDITSTLAFHFSRLFNLDVRDLLSPHKELQMSFAVPTIMYKLSKKADVNRINAQSFFYLILARHILSASKITSQKIKLKEAKSIRLDIVRKFGEITFTSTLNYIWSLGIPVVPIRNNKTFHGACIRIDGRNVIILSQNTKFESRLLFDLLHELKHTQQNPSEKDIAVFEETESAKDWQNTDEEIEANRFAGDILLDCKSEELAKECVKEAAGNIPYLKTAVVRVANRANLSVSALANYMAFRLMLQDTNWWGTANNLQEESDFHWSIALYSFIDNIELDSLEEPYRSVILRVLREE